jgi:hypothetical protein
MKSHDIPLNPTFFQHYPHLFHPPSAATSPNLAAVEKTGQKQATSAVPRGTCGSLGPRVVGIAALHTMQRRHDLHAQKWRSKICWFKMI